LNVKEAEAAKTVQHIERAGVKIQFLTTSTTSRMWWIHGGLFGLSSKATFGKDLIKPLRRSNLNLYPAVKLNPFWVSFLTISSTRFKTILLPID